MDYKSVFTNLCLELQQNRSWIKGLGKNPQKSELIHWRQCLLSGGTKACSLGLRETPACIHVIQRLSQPRVACWHSFRQNSQKTECVFTRCPTGGRKKKSCIYGLRSEGVKGTHRLCRAKLGDKKRPSIFRCFSYGWKDLSKVEYNCRHKYPWKMHCLSRKLTRS